VYLAAFIVGLSTVIFSLAFAATWVFGRYLLLTHSDFTLLLTIGEVGIAVGLAISGVLIVRLERPLATAAILIGRPRHGWAWPAFPSGWSCARSL